MSDTAHAGYAADRNLLFGVLALQADLLDNDRFAEACSAWAARKGTPLSDLLVERGWLSPADRADVEKLLERKLRKHGGDAAAGLAEVASEGVRQTLAGLDDPAVRQTLCAAAPADGVHEQTTIAYRPAGRDRYTLTRLHAKGGLGQVWVAHDTDLGRDVAFKELRDGRADDPGLLARFVEEAQITGQLEHPNIVPVYELARPAGTGSGPFYTMRFIRGRTLAAAIKEYHRRRRAKEAGPLELRELLGHFTAVCNAVAYAHSRGVLHRDLKPQNVVLGDYGEVIVLDWGLAKLKGAAEPRPSLVPVSLGQEAGREGTVQGQALGTPCYMPPEQAEGRLDLIDERSDVYGLGAVLYEILAGEPPFDGPDTPAILVQVLADPVVPPRRRVPATPPALEAVCLKALAKRPEGRYASAKGLAQEVERWLADEPVAAWREPWPTRAARWVRRRRTQVAAAVAAAFVALLLGGAGLVWQQREQAQRRQEQERRLAAAEAALERVGELQAKARWAEARAALEQAEDRLGAGGPAELRQRLGQAQRDLKLVSRLDDLRVEGASNRAKSRDAMNAALDRGYEAAFVEAGLGTPTDDPAAVAGRVAGSAVREAAVEGLDYWATVVSGERRVWALEVARRADPDPWRDRLRDPATWQDLPALAKLARDVPARAVTPGLAAAVGRRLISAGEGERLLRAAQAVQPADFWLNEYLSNVLSNKGRHGEAEGFGRAALAARPDSLVAQANLGFELFSQGKLEEADVLYRKVLERDPDDDNSMNNLGGVLWRQGRREEAVAQFRQAIAVLRRSIERDPKDDSLYLRLGNVLDSIGDMKEATAVARKAIELNPRNVQAYDLLSRAYRMQRKFNEAATAYRKALEVFPDNARLHGKLGRQLLQQGKLDEAATSLRKALELDATLAEAHSNLGLLLERQGKAQEAVALFRRALELDPNNAETIAGFGWELEYAGKPKEAAAAYRKAVELAPKLPYPHRDLTRVLLGLRQYREAAEAARRALPLLPAGDATRTEIEGYLRRAELEGRLPALLRGDDRPANPGEGLAFAERCRARRHYAAAARLSADAFAAEPQFAGDLRRFYRYNAACSAALAGCGKGEGVPPASEERARWRRQALAWLRADLAAQSGQLAGQPEEKAEALKQLRHWLADQDFVGVRDAAGLAQLPEAERKEWEAFWAEVKALLDKPPAGK